MRMDLVISKSFHQNILLRFLAKPIVEFSRRMELSRYIKTEDSNFIKNFKNLYDGERCFIIGNGPSLSANDLDLLIGEKTFACNRIYNIFPQTYWRPTFYMCGDRECLKDEITNIKELHGCIKWVSLLARRYGREEADELHFYNQYGPFCIHIENKVQNGVSEDVSRYFSTTQTVTCQEIEFAIYMGFKEIYLLGVDHNYPISIDKNGHKIMDNTVKSHFDGGGSKESSLHYIYYDAATQCYQVCEDYAKSHGIKIYNATRGGKLEVFKRVNLEDVLNS